MNPSSNDWVGLGIADGRYQVLERIGFGSMGIVYRAHDQHLDTEVVIKSPVPEEVESLGPLSSKRFEFESRSLVQLTHPHIVKIFDVGQHDGCPYVVMQYLSGGTLRDRAQAGPGGEARPMPPSSLWNWLLDVAKALDFIHAENYLHRDVKPDNILFDRQGNAFLSDFGIVKLLAQKGHDRRSNTITAPGYLMGTPNYVAPEVVMGGPVDSRVDQYSLAMTVHEILLGTNVMEGPTASATMVNQTKLSPPALAGLIPGVPARLSDAVLRGLSKEPNDRYPSCTALASEILAEVPAPTPSASWAFIGAPAVGSTSRGEPGRVNCPSCLSRLPVGLEFAGKTIRCTRCNATLQVRSSGPHDLSLIVVELPPAKEHDPGATGRSWSIRAPSPSFQLLGAGSGSGRRARTMLLIALAGVFLVAGAFLIRRELKNASSAGPVDRDDRPGTGIGAGPSLVKAPVPPPPEAEPVVINIAYGTEKKKWLEDSLKEFSTTPQGREIRVHLYGLGSLEGANLILEGPKPASPPHVPIHVWSPASSTYRDLLESDWRAKHGKSPILSAENLALTPMVFVMWKQRYDEFAKKYAQVNFRNVAEAMAETSGWEGIAKKPDWGLFKFGHTDPNKSNSGLQMLILMVHEYTGKPRALTVGDASQPNFLDWLRAFERGVTRPGGRLTHSTGTLMEEMVLRGPSQYDCLILYENLAIDYMSTAIERWGEEGELYVSYPNPNIWNEHPYYILDVPWSDDRQRKAAAEFLRFLMSVPTQRRALVHGFRPGNSAVPVNTPESPLIRNQRYGLKIKLPTMCEPPSAEVLRALLEAARVIDR